MQNTTCTEDRIQHALERCLDGLGHINDMPQPWNGKLRFLRGINLHQCYFNIQCIFNTLLMKHVLFYIYIYHRARASVYLKTYLVWGERLPSGLGFTRWRTEALPYRLKKVTLTLTQFYLHYADEWHLGFSLLLSAILTERPSLRRFFFVAFNPFRWDRISKHDRCFFTSPLTTRLNSVACFFCFFW